MTQLSCGVAKVLNPGIIDTTASNANHLYVECMFVCLFLQFGLQHSILALLAQTCLDDLMASCTISCERKKKPCFYDWWGDSFFESLYW